MVRKRLGPQFLSAARQRGAELLIAARTLLLRTDVQRWRKVSGEPPPWDHRNQIIARLIPPNSSVLDLGAGAQTLRKHLDPRCQYQPCDIIPSTPDVITCDFNAGRYPRLTRQYDFVVCSGILEYMRDPAAFIRAIGDYGTTILLSYHPRSAEIGRLRRLGNGWVNHLRLPELETLFSDNGLVARTVHQESGGQMIFELKQRAPRAPASPPLNLALGFDFYGAGNIGDDLALAGFLQAIQTLNLAPLLSIFATTSHDPISQQKRFPSLQWICRGADRPENVLADKHIDIWAGVGDTPFQITCGPWFLQFLQQEAERTADIHRRVLVGVGAESEIESHLDEFRRIARQFDRVSVRDQHSYDILVERLGLPAERVALGADLAHLSLANLFPAPVETRDFALGLMVAGDTMTPADLEAVGRFALAQAEPIAFLAGETRDQPGFEPHIHRYLIERFGPQMADRLRLFVPPYRDGSLLDLVQPIARCATVISARFHGLLAAAWAGCRVAAVGRSSKVVALASELQIPMAALPLDEEQLSKLAQQAAPVPRSALFPLLERARAGVAFSLQHVWDSRGGAGV